MAYGNHDALADLGAIWLEAEMERTGRDMHDLLDEGAKQLAQIMFGTNDETDQP